MNERAYPLIARLEKAEFEGRIFVSLGIVALIGTASVFSDLPPTFEIAWRLAGVGTETAATLSFISLAVLMLFISLLRIWAGSILTPERVMAFKVQVDVLKAAGPYRFVRNPIYLVDFAALCGFSLCLSPVGLLIPLFFYVHYTNLIRYEEAALRRRFGKGYEETFKGIPRFCPHWRQVGQMKTMLSEFRITGPGIRHNALYVLFIPGFLVAALTHQFLHTVLIGLPGVVDWAVIHTKIGTRKGGIRQ